MTNNKTYWLYAIAFVLATTLWATSTAFAQTSDLFFSEYIEGSSNNKALEIYNDTGAPVDLAAGGYQVQMYFNGNSAATLAINLAGTVATGDVFVLAQASANSTILAVADQTSDSGWFNGDDAVVLLKNDTIIDVIGQIGNDPGTQWGSDLTSTADNTLRRKNSICAGDPNGSDAFDPSVSWDGFAQDTFDGLGSHAAACDLGDVPPRIVETQPADGATGVEPTANLVVTFSEAVTVPNDNSWYTVACSVSGNVTAVVSTSDSVTYTFDPAVDLAAAEDCTVTLEPALVVDQDEQSDALSGDFDWTFTVSAFGVCSDPATPIATIQGAGAASVLVGQTQVVEAIVVGDYQDIDREFDGFFLQEETVDQDDNTLTSEGVFIYDNGFGIDVGVGDVVRVEGVVGENFNQTQLRNITQVVICADRTPEQLTQELALTPVEMPASDVNEWERVESMLVTIPTTLTVTENFNLGRFGEVDLAFGGRLYQPTQVAEPGAPAAAVAQQNALRKLLLDDGLSPQNVDPVRYPAPELTAENTLRVGDTVVGLTGVIDYRFNRYRMQPVPGYAPNFIASNPRPQTPEPAGGTLKVGSFNVLNYFPELDVDGGPGDNVCGPQNSQECRGADETDRLPGDRPEFERQRAKIVTALVGLDADVVGLLEIENSPTDEATADLVNSLNAALGSEVYDYIATGDIGTDAIRVAMIYKPALVTPQDSYAVLDSSVDPDFEDTRSRPVLAQTFLENASGELFTVAVAHLKSKGSECPEDEVTTPSPTDVQQGSCNQVRLRAAQAMVDWLASDPTGSDDPDVLIIGDLNSYAMEEPIQALEAGGYTNLILQFVGAEASSYVFEGQSGTLDHALASATVADNVTNAAEWAINADEPRVLDYNVEFKTEAQLTKFYAPDAFRSSDHDPLLLGLCLDETAPVATVTATPNQLWPPNRQVEQVTTTVNVNEEDTTITLVSVRSSDPDTSQGDQTTGDVVVVDDSTFQLRAERRGNSSRTYTLTYLVTDRCGNSSTAAATVTVPANQGNSKGNVGALGVEEGADLPRIFLPLVE